MASDQEIRSWARDAGHDVPVRGRLGEEWRELYAAAHDDADDGNSELSALRAELEGQESLPGFDPADSGEIAPVRPAASRPSPAAKITKGKLFGGSRQPKVHKRRSLEDLAADGWGVMAALVHSQGLVPTSRVLRMQAPVAGVILEDTLRGTLADRVLQPLARSTEKSREIGALIGPPLIVSVLSVKPGLAPQLLPILKSSLRSWILIAGPKMKALEKREAKAMEEMGLDSSEELDGMLEDMIASFFTMETEPVPGETQMPRAA